MYYDYIRCNDFPLDRTTKIKHMSKPVPSVSPYYVVRKYEWEIMTHHLVSSSEDKRKIVTITGMDGCGKTQMVAYFVEKYRNKLVSSEFQAITILIYDRYWHIFFIDASTAATIRGGLESAISAINGHEKNAYKGALMFMSSPPENGEWLFILDTQAQPPPTLSIPMQLMPLPTWQLRYGIKENGTRQKYSREKY
jgi:hypothetical protein